MGEVVTSDPLVSVVLPFYNRRDTLLRAVRSVLNQTYENLELVCVDDGSDDGSAELLSLIEDGRLHLVRQENKGACAARNLGIRHSSGEFVAFQDSDDSWRPMKLELQVAALWNTGADVCFCRLERHGYSNKDPRIWPTSAAGFVPRENLALESLASTQTIIARKEVFNSDLFDEGIPRLQDYDWVIAASSRHSFYLLNEVLVDVYLQGDSLTLTGAEKLNRSYEMVVEKHLQEFEDFPEVQAKMLYRYAASCAAVGVNPCEAYRRSFELAPNMKAAIKYVLSLLHIYI